MDSTHEPIYNQDKRPPLSGNTGEDYPSWTVWQDRQAFIVYAERGDQHEMMYFTTFFSDHPMWLTAVDIRDDILSKFFQNGPPKDMRVAINAVKTSLF